MRADEYHATDLLETGGLQSEKALEELSDETLLVLEKHAEFLIRMEACLQVMEARVEELERELDARQSAHK